MKRIIFTIYFDIPKDDLDNPGSWDNQTGKIRSTNKSVFTKMQLALYKDRLVNAQKEYATACGTDYRVVEDSSPFIDFLNRVREICSDISVYDCLNFYKHRIMRDLCDEGYDEICYFDLDVVPLSSKNLFEEFDFSSFHVGDSNKESLWGRTVELEYYNACIRNPASKYFNAQALAFECGIDSVEDVFNTGIMFSSSSVIKQLDYFGSFADDLEDMTRTKQDSDSMYPWAIQRSFGYDNETLFAHKVARNNLPYQLLPATWNVTLLDPETLQSADLVHVISKEFDKIL